MSVARYLGAVFVSCGAAASAGTLADSFSASVWGRSAQVRTWNTFFDVSGGVIGPYEGRALGMAFQNGALYVVTGATLTDGGPIVYTPTAAGDLSVATSRPVFVGVPPVGLRFIEARSVAINTSGSGYGAFGAGAAPTLVVGGAQQGSSSPLTVALNTANNPTGAAGPASVQGAADGVRSLAYAAALDRFISVGTSSAAASTIRVHGHTASGIGAAESSFAAIGGVTAVQQVSASFASALLGQTVTQAALLAAGRNDLGEVAPPFLALYSFSGTLLGSTDIALRHPVGGPPGGAAFSNTIDIRSLAVDEASGLVYLGDRGGLIYTVGIPAPGSALGMVIAGFAASARRRRRR